MIPSRFRALGVQDIPPLQEARRRRAPPCYLFLGQWNMMPTVALPLLQSYSLASFPKCEPAFVTHGTSHGLRSHVLPCPGTTIGPPRDGFPLPRALRLCWGRFACIGSAIVPICSRPPSGPRRTKWDSRQHMPPRRISTIIRPRGLSLVGCRDNPKLVSDCGGISANRPIYLPLFPCPMSERQTRGEPNVADPGELRRRI